MTAVLDQGRRPHRTIACFAAAAAFLQVCNGAAAQPAGNASTQSLQDDELRRMKEHLDQVLPPAIAPLPAPPADVRDLNGTWVPNQVTPLHMTHDAYGKEIPLNDEARKLLEVRQKAIYVHTAPLQNAGQLCLPPGQPWLFGLLTPFTILQSPTAITFMTSEYHMVWGATLSGTPPTPSAPQYMGQSTGHWEGDTLVIEARNFKLDMWLEPEGLPASKDAHVTMRIKRVDQPDPVLQVAITIDDPRVFAAPWTFLRTYAWRPDMEVFEEYDCEPQVYADWAKENGLAPAGEPK